MKRVISFKRVLSISVVFVTMIMVLSCDPINVDKDSDDNQIEVPGSNPPNPDNPTKPDKPGGVEIADAFDSGDGTAKNPYMIANAAQLRKLAKDLESGMTYREEYFKLKNDIVINKKVLTEKGKLVANHSDLEQWKPIDKFYGTFDGDGHSISGIYINNEQSLQGLFGSLYGEVSNLSLIDSYICGEDYIGGIAASAGLNKKEKLYVAK